MQENLETKDITQKTETNLTRRPSGNTGRRTNKYYVYCLIDPRNNLPFYIGKGSKYRYYEHVKCVKRGKIPNNNLYLFNKIKKILDGGLDIEVVFIKKNMNEEAAFNLEKNEIYKAKNNNIKLCNLTDGGEGASGYIPTDKFKLKMSKLFMGKGNPFYGKHHTKEVKDKIKNNTPILKGADNPFYGKHHTEEVRGILSKSHVGLFSKEKHPMWKEVNKKNKMGIANNYKLCGMTNTLHKFKNYGYDVIKRILIDAGIFGKYKYYGRPKVIISVKITKRIISLRRRGFTIREIIKKLKVDNIIISFEKTRKIVNSI